MLVKIQSLKLFASLKSSDDYTIAFGRPVFSNSYYLTGCCVFSHNHAILKWDNLLNNKTPDFFSFHTILHQHSRNTSNYISINCWINIKDYNQIISKKQLLPGTCLCCEISVIIFCLDSEAIHEHADKSLKQNWNFILKNPTK